MKRALKIEIKVRIPGQKITVENGDLISANPYINPWKEAADSSYRKQGLGNIAAILTSTSTSTPASCFLLPQSIPRSLVVV